MINDDFLKPGQHFDHLVKSLEPDAFKLYRSLRHSRSETGFRNRNFVVYKIIERDAKIIDNVKILDFQCDDEYGASFEIRSEALKETLTVGYEPVQVFDYPVFIHASLHSKINWSTTLNNIKEGKPGSLSFDIVLKTQSRLHLRERGVTYMEAGTAFAREFEGANV